MTARDVPFTGVERFTADEPLRTELGREHGGLRSALANVAQSFVPRFRVVSTGLPKVSATPWDFVEAVSGGTIYLPSLTTADEGDTVMVGIVTNSATVVADDGAEIVGSVTVTGPTSVAFRWTGVRWYRHG